MNQELAYRLIRGAGLLLQRHTGKPTRPHEGSVTTLKSDLRWCSDGFEIHCSTSSSAPMSPGAWRNQSPTEERRPERAWLAAPGA